jgi:hypothetical protein
LGGELITDLDPFTNLNRSKSGNSIAIIQQFTCISKQRIIRPLNSGDKRLGKVSPAKMADIDKKIAQRYLSYISIPSASN